VMVKPSRGHKQLKWRAAARDMASQPATVIWTEKAEEGIWPNGG
jgi:hypothetical protein